jgi:tRNA threonylcarbamoyl adenosine modification protein YeaZ
MRYLLLDASENATTSQYGDDADFFSRRFDTDRNLGACISKICDEMLAQAGCSFAELDRLAICTGPGSLTGLRIAAAFFRTLALIGEKPVCGIDIFNWSLKTLQMQGNRGEVSLVLPTLIDKAFVVDGNIEQQTCQAPQLQTRSEVSRSQAFSIRCELPGCSRLEPSPTALHELIKSQPAASSFSDILGVLPMYVIPSQAERKFEENQ